MSASTTENKRVLVHVATKHGHAAFWLDRLIQIEDKEDGETLITLKPVDQGERRIKSAWSTARVLQAIQEAL